MTHHIQHRATHAKLARVLDLVTGQYMRFKLQCNCEPGDNPAQSEVAGHMGVGSNFLCHKCHAGGTKKEKQSNPGVLRTVQETLKEVEHQLQLASRGVALTVTTRQTETGVKDVYTQFWIEWLIQWSQEQQKCREGQSLEEIKAELMDLIESDHDSVYNPFLTLKYSNVNQDTPVEILHTILLGIVKYGWHTTHTTWKDNQKALYASRLQSTDPEGLSIPAICAGYIMQYANLLIGWQLKILAQTNVFYIYDLVSADQYQLIKATGVLAALLWVPEIFNMGEYLEDVKIAVANVLDSAAKLDPSKIIAKMKYHLLVHIPDDVERLGSIIGQATESHESFNLVFRHCSVLSNHQSPSRNIAYQLAKQDTFRHLISGGWYKERGESNPEQWKLSGHVLLQYVEKSEVLKQIYHIGPHLRGKENVGATVLKPISHKDKEPRSRICQAHQENGKVLFWCLPKAPRLPSYPAY
ncbi:hypothetical protein FA13DRAFT_1807811 [Coprinellus micaceus]|uniref:Uncharacterized protein n=1 Tax=Coprinellus micaceus TaxID=71717 RepID=A0A4Y7R4H4_COPMI|nr:hypothetical protein FA13DRAFT_1807811 [Coprinellus micaceus]